jgi:hypothetical protein
VTTSDDPSNRPVAAPAPKVLITGSGRAGTTLLVQVLTDLGLDTGVAPDTAIDERANAGLELPVDDPAGPRIVKSPTIIPRLGRLLDAGTLTLEHVIVPIRDLDVAAASRIRLTKYGTDLHTWGGLMGTRRADKQREALALLEYELFLTMARHEVPHTFLVFPRFTHDWEYTHRQLSFLDPSISPDRWRDALARLVRPTLIHEQSLSRGEQLMTRAGAAYNGLVARPARAIARLLRRSRRTDSVIESNETTGRTTR